MVTDTIITRRKEEFIDITDRVAEALKKSGLKEGVAVVYVPHTTAGVTINECADPDVCSDVIRHLDKMVPQQGRYEHAEGNSPAHIKSILTGSSVSIPYQNGRLMLGRWQAVFFCEYDGPRTRSVLIAL